MISARRWVIILFLLSGSARAQEIGSIDLTHPTANTKSATSQSVPRGCKEISPGGIGDGAVVPSHSGPRDITVQLVRLSTTKPKVGSQVQGDVQLRNSGKFPVQIPWMTDLSIALQGQGPLKMSWETGQFNFLLAGSGPLKGVSAWLYGSKDAPTTELTIQPGQWVTATVLLDFELEYPIGGRYVKSGEAQLRAEWEQNSHTQAVKDCTFFTGFFTYRNYYRQQNLPITITVN